MSVWYNPERDELALYWELEAILERKLSMVFWSREPMIEAGWIYLGKF